MAGAESNRIEKDAMLSLENVSKVFRTRHGPVRALEKVSLSIEAGEFTVVRGPSGSGKTTLLLALGGMQRPTSGRVLVRDSGQASGRDLYAMSSAERARFRARRVGFVFQMFHLVPYLNVTDNVLLAAGRGGAAAAAGELIERLGLAGRRHHRPADLSAGERQRAAIARALVNDPDVILADEPTGNLDPENAEDVLGRLAEFHRKGGTVVVVTHSAAADGFATRIVRQREGGIEGDGKESTARPTAADRPEEPEET